MNTLYLSYSSLGSDLLELKYETIPLSYNGILRPVFLIEIQWLSMLRYEQYILGMSLTISPHSLIINGGIKLGA